MFLTSTLDAGNRCVLFPGRFTPGKKPLESGEWYRISPELVWTVEKKSVSEIELQSLGHPSIP